MGSYDGAEICELVRLYLLGKLAPLIGTKNVGLYRDDGLAVIHQANGPKMDRIRKDIIALFKSKGLSITIDTNLIELGQEGGQKGSLSLKSVTHILE